MGAHLYTLYMWTNYVLLIGFTQPNRCNSQHNKNQRHRKFGLDVVVAMNTCVYASVAHLKFYTNQIEIWFDIYLVATDVVCMLWKFAIVAKTNYQTPFNVHCTHTHIQQWHFKIYSHPSDRHYAMKTHA